MNSVNINEVETKAAEFEAFASHPSLRDFEREDYLKRAENLRDFARVLRGWRKQDESIAEQARRDAEYRREAYA